MRMLKKNLNRPQLMRLLKLDEAIRSGKYPNCSSFAKSYEVSYKTIQRDIDFLRTIGAPLEFDPAHNGFRYTDTAWQMPGLELTEGEFLALLMFTRVGKLFKNTPLAEELDSLAEKMRAVLHGPINADPAMFQQYFSFLPMPSRPVRREVWCELFNAVRIRHSVDMHYTTPGEAKSKWRVVEPLHLVCIGEEWYLTALDRPSDEIRNFALSRINELRDTGNEFEPVPFDPTKYYANRFGRFVGKPGEGKPVSIRFSADVAQWILEREWHPEQKIKRNKDGSIVLTFPAPSMYVVERWVREWGGDAAFLDDKEMV